MREFLAHLESIFPKSSLLLEDEVPDRYRGDWSNEPMSRPLAVVRPTDATQVAQAVTACVRFKVPFVAQGGMTGLCGGANPEPDWVAISLERMSGIEEIDPINSTMTVRAGTPLEVVQNAADEAGFLFPLDLGARGSCSIGGNIATNAGGNRVIRYGMTRDLVLGLEVVLPDGTVMESLNKLLKNNAGYDLKQIFIGSEGTLGVVTRAVLRIFPKPRCTMVALCGLASFADVEALLRSARAKLGSSLSAFEVMWQDFWSVATKASKSRSPISAGHAHYVLVEIHGADEALDRERFQAWLEEAMEAGLLADAAVAQTIGQSLEFWSLRDSGAEFAAAIGPHLSYDIGITVELMDEFVVKCRSRLSERIDGCKAVFYGHIGDGNLHLDAWVPGRPIDKVLKAATDSVVYSLVEETSGTISAEHGIGTSKAPWLNRSRTGAEIALMKALKRTLDPQGLLNPGKVVSI